MSETRATKQVSVLSRISSMLPKATDLFIEASSAILSPSITLDALNSFSNETRSLYSNISGLSSDLREFCDDESQTRFKSQLIQVQSTLASLCTTITSNIMSRSQHSQSSSIN